MTRFDVVAIGRVESTLADLAAAPRQPDEGAPPAWLAFEPAVLEGLANLHVGDEVLLLTWLDRARRTAPTRSGCITSRSSASRARASASAAWRPSTARPSSTSSPSWATSIDAERPPGHIRARAHSSGPGGRGWPRHRGRLDTCTGRAGHRVRVEQSGFRLEDERLYQGAARAAPGSSSGSSASPAVCRRDETPGGARP